MVNSMHQHIDFVGQSSNSHLPFTQLYGIQMAESKLLMQVICMTNYANLSPVQQLQDMVQGRLCGL